MRRLLLAATLAFLGVRCAAANEVAPPEPQTYRLENYRAPTPKTLAGARVLTTDEAEALWKSGSAVFVDVLPHAPRPANLPPGTIWREKTHMNIPGSYWLPDTGYGEIAPSTESYLRDGLRQITSGDTNKLLVIYCQRDCWMSWNAAKRILSLGYTHVAWYPDGTDGWEEHLLQLAKSEPLAR